MENFLFKMNNNNNSEVITEGIVKTTLKESPLGEGVTCKVADNFAVGYPVYESRIKFHMKVTGEGGTPVYLDSNTTGEMLDFEIGNDNIPLLLEGVLITMKKNEVAQFDISAHHNHENFLNIPQHVSIQCTIHIIDIQNTPNPPPKEKYSAALQRKIEGNVFCDKKKYLVALSKYFRAIEISSELPWEDRDKGRKDIDLPCYLNMAMCALELKDFKNSVYYATKALEIDSSNVKGHFRRGVAYTETGEWIEAENDFKFALEFADKAPKKRIKESLAYLKKCMAEQDRKDKESCQKIFNRKFYYDALYNEIQALISSEIDLIANTSNVVSAIHEKLNKYNNNKINWTGFYFLLHNGQLLLGPFQGKVARPRIGWRQGVCGAVVERKQTIIVPDIHTFNGHTTTDPDTISEIAIPILRKGTVVGVLDINSMVLGGFDDQDKEHLEKIVSLLPTNCNWNNFQRLLHNVVETTQSTPNYTIAIGISISLVVVVSVCVWQFMPSFKRLKMKK